jgi:hypothetical protein
MHRNAGKSPPERVLWRAYKEAGMKNKCPRGYCRVGAKGFKIVIRSYGGVWAQEKDVYFTQMASTYTASYLPRYPEKSPNDSSVTYNHIKDFWQYNGPATENIRQYQGR